MTGGELDVESIDTGGERVGLWTLSGARWVLHEPLAAGSLNLLAGSELSAPEPTWQEVVAVEIDLGGALLVDASSAIDLRGRGHVGGLRGGNPLVTGQGPEGEPLAVGGRTGGSHGGLGGYQDAGAGRGTTVAPVTDDLREPRVAGSGGSGLLGSSEEGSNGGGVLRLRASSLVLFGRIDASGEGAWDGPEVETPRRGGGGAGGAIWIDVGSLFGTGAILAEGGTGHGPTGSGGGGGGRIAIHCLDRGGFAGEVLARGGTLDPWLPKPHSFGGAGTVLWIGPDLPFGELIVHGAGTEREEARTRLRPVGTGTIRLLAPHVLTADPVFPTSDTGLSGLWALVGGDTSRAFRILGSDASRLWTDPADGEMTVLAGPGDPYGGAIVLDRLTVSGGAWLSTEGDVVILSPSGELRITAGSHLEAPPLVRW